MFQKLKESFNIITCFTMPPLTTNIRSLRKGSRQYSASIFFLLIISDFFLLYFIPECLLGMTWWRNSIKPMRNTLTCSAKINYKARGVYIPQGSKKTQQKAKPKLPLFLKICLHHLTPNTSTQINTNLLFESIFPLLLNDGNWIIYIPATYFKAVHEWLLLIFSKNTEAETHFKEICICSICWKMEKEQVKHFRLISLANNLYETMLHGKTGLLT